MSALMHLNPTIYAMVKLAKHLETGNCPLNIIPGSKHPARKGCLLWKASCSPGPSSVPESLMSLICWPYVLLAN